MERKVNYEAFDGRTFEMKSDCYAYEEALRETYNKQSNEHIASHFGKPLLEQRQLKNMKGITNIYQLIW